MTDRAKRKPLTRSQFAQLVLSQKGKCAACKSKLDFTAAGLVIDEHIVPIFSTPSGLDPNRTENRELRCKPCATKKTSAEAPDRAKVRRIEGQNTQADKRQRAKDEGRHKTIPGRPFQQNSQPLQGRATMQSRPFAGSKRFSGEINWKIPAQSPEK